MKIAGLSVIVRASSYKSQTIPSPGRQTCARVEFFVGKVGNTSLLLLHLIRFYHCIALAQMGSSQINRNNYL